MLNSNFSIYFYWSVQPETFSMNLKHFLKIHYNRKTKSSIIWINQLITKRLISFQFHFSFLKQKKKNQSINHCIENVSLLIYHWFDNCNVIFKSHNFSIVLFFFFCSLPEFNIAKSANQIYNNKTKIKIKNEYNLEIRNWIKQRKQQFKNNNFNNEISYRKKKEKYATWESRTTNKTTTF